MLRDAVTIIIHGVYDGYCRRQLFSDEGKLLRGGQPLNCGDLQLTIWLNGARAVVYEPSMCNLECWRKLKWDEQR